MAEELYKNDEKIDIVEDQLFSVPLQTLFNFGLNYPVNLSRLSLSATMKSFCLILTLIKQISRIEFE